jgi:cytochrome P450
MCILSTVQMFPLTAMVHSMKFDWSFIALPYGDVWRRKRRMMYSHMSRTASARFHPVQAISAYHFARDLLASEMSPESLHRSVSLYLGQMLIKAVYGIDVEDEQSQYIQLPQQIVNNFAKATVPGNFMIDLLPSRELHARFALGNTERVPVKYVPAWFPGAGFQRLAQNHREMQRRALDAPIELIEAEMVRFPNIPAHSDPDWLLQAEGAAPPSMAQEMLEEDSERVRHEDIKDVAGLAYVGGNDTTGAVVLSFFLAMLVYPEVQAKAQAEVDRVVGKDRMPEFADEQDMPYVQAVVNECLRWLPMGPMGAVEACCASWHQLNATCRRAPSPDAG